MNQTRFAMLAALAVAAMLAACGDGDDGAAPSEPTATARGSEASQTPSPDATDEIASEGGRDPVFWRTVDNFRSVRANEPYKVVLRVTNGFNADVLLIEAASEVGSAVIAFEAMRVDAPGEDKGTFYTVNLEFPRQGRYAVAFIAGEDTATIDVDVLAEAAPSG